MAVPAATAGKPRPHVARWRSAVFRSPLPPAEKLAVLALGEFADADGSNCYPSIPSVAELAGVNERTVRRATNVAIKAGLIQRVHRGGNSMGWRRYAYRLVIPGSDEGADTLTTRSDERAGVMSTRSGNAITSSAPPPGEGVVSAGCGDGGCGHLAHRVRTSRPEGAGVMSTDLDHYLDHYLEEAKAVHLPMHADAEKDRHPDNGEPLSTPNGQSTFAWAMQHAPNGTPADRWAAWVHHTLETFDATEAGMRRKLLAEARYLDTCTDSAAEIDAAIQQGDDCLTNDWMDEPGGPTHRGAGGEAGTMTALRTIGVFDGRIPDEAITDDFPDVPPVPRQSGTHGTPDDAAAYRAAKDGE